MPGYLDNNIYQGAGNAAAGMGDAFTRAIVGTQQLRYQQAQMQQQQAMEAARLEMERQRLVQNAPFIQAQTDYNRAGAELDRGKLADLRMGQQAGGMLGDVMKGIGQTDPARNPQTMQLLQAIAAQQQAVLASQSPGNIARQSADIQMGMSPEGRRFVSAGYPPKQGMSPEQEFMSRIYAKVIADAMAPETTETTNIRGEKTKSTTRDIQGGLDLSDIVARGMFPGSTNLPPRISAGGSEAPPPQAPGLASRPVTPKPGDVLKGYRFKGGDPSKQESWEVVQ